MIPKQLKNFTFVKMGINSKGERMVLHKYTKPEDRFKSDDPLLLEHVKKGGNFGYYIGEGYTMIDSDTPEVKDLLETLFGKTFTIKTRKGFHLLYESQLKKVTKKQIIQLRKPNDKTDYGTIHTGNQVGTAPLSRHHKDKDFIYSVCVDEPIKRIRPRYIFDALKDYIGHASQSTLSNYPQERAEEIPTGTTTLKEVHDTFKKYLHLNNTMLIDLVLAVANTRKKDGTKLWLIIKNNSGGGKNEVIGSLDDDGKTTYYLHNITARTLVSGAKAKHVQDLAPLLQGKILIIPEMAQLLQLHPNEKGQVWAQFRDLYDGLAGKATGSGKKTRYTGLNVTMIAGATPAIDSQILLQQSLGSRELMFRPTKEDDTQQEALMNMVLANEQHETEMKAELKQVFRSFVDSHEYNDIEVPDDVMERIKAMAVYLTFMRAPAEIDSKTGEVINDAHPEKPTRVLKQLKILYCSLMSLDPNYSSEEALRIIQQVVFSSSIPNRVKVFNHLLAMEPTRYSEYEIHNTLKISRMSVKRELNVLWNLELINKENGEYNPSTRYARIEWGINKLSHFYTIVKNNKRG